MKKLHLFILKSYLGPLAMTFFISLFILVMQFLWNYVDELVGKGLDFIVVIELLLYATLQVIPMALPLAILLASLMTFGNLGENYELTAIKAAGISLPKIMRPLIVVTLFISIGAFWFSNNIMPIANLKLFSLLFDVKQAKPESGIKEKVFYTGIDDFRMKIDKKDNSTGLQYGIMIYDHRDQNITNGNVTIADSGRMQISEDKRDMILTLLDGVRFDEKVWPNNNKLRERDQQRFRRDIFKEQIAWIKLQGMNFNRSDESGFSSYDRMKNLNQLKHDIDSFQIKKQNHISLLNNITRTFFFKPAINHASHLGQSESSFDIDSCHSYKVDSLFTTFTANEKNAIIENALRKVRNNKNRMHAQFMHIRAENAKIKVHSMEVHRKFTLSFACIIFFFIGAPLGAIIRKGGLGMPVVISVLFFIVYYIIDTLGANFAREAVLPVYQGMWLSSVVLLPLGMFLTYKSATDSTLLNTDAYTVFFRKLFKREEYDLNNKMDAD